MTTPTQDKKGSTSPGQGDEHMFDTSLGSPTFESPIREQPADGAAAEADSSKPAQLSPEEIEKMKDELEKVENEIVTLRQVLGSKVRYATELKRKLGITPFQELKQDIQYGIKSIKDSETVVKTNEKLTNIKERITSSSAFQKTNEKIHDINDKLTHSSAYQKTSNAMKTASEKTNAVVSSIGASVSKKIGDIKNSQTFKSMEEKVGGAYSNVKAKVTGSKSEGSFEEALASEKQESGANGDTPSNLDSLPEEKVPL